jgi:hypothetical protein
MLSASSTEEDQIEIRIGGQQDDQFLQGVINEFGTPDIVLDDGSHVRSHVVASFQFFYPRMAFLGARQRPRTEAQLADQPDFRELLGSQA